MQVLRLPEPDFRPLSLAFSPDAGRLVAAGDGRWDVIDTAAGAARTLQPGDVTPVRYGVAVAFTADGRWVLVREESFRSDGIGVFDAETGAAVGKLALRDHDRFAPLPGRPEVLVASHPTPGQANVEFARWNPRTGARSAPFARHVNVVRQLAVSADGRWLAGAGGYEVRLWRLDGPKPPGRASRRLSVEPALVVALAVSADGAQVAVGTFDGPDSVRLIDAATGASEVIGPRPRESSVRDLAFHPGRPVLALRGGPGEVAFYDAAARTELKRFAWDVGDISAVCFSPDGLRCAAAGRGKVVVWDVDL